MQRQIASAESAIHSYTDLSMIDGDSGALNRAFSADPIIRLEPWGDAPGWLESAPSALNKYLRRPRICLEAE